MSKYKYDFTVHQDDIDLDNVLRETFIYLLRKSKLFCRVFEGASISYIALYITIYYSCE